MEGNSATRNVKEGTKYQYGRRKRRQNLAELRKAKQAKATTEDNSGPNETDSGTKQTAFAFKLSKRTDTHHANGMFKMNYNLYYCILYYTLIKYHR